MGKTRKLFKKNQRYQGNIACRMGTIKGRKEKDLTEEEEINEKWQEYIKKLVQRNLLTQITLMVWPLT